MLDKKRALTAAAYRQAANSQTSYVLGTTTTDNGVPAEELEEFHERMVEALSKVYLRFEFRNNVPTERLHEWAVEARVEIERFRSRVEDVRTRVLSTYDPEATLSTVAESYNTTVHEEIGSIA